jgi:hypothetical protein
MSYTLSYSSYARHQAPLKSEFGGSSKYSVIDGEITPKAKPRIIPKTKKEDTSTPDCGEREIFTDVEDIKHSTLEIDDKPPTKFKLNKSKVRKRCNALSRLEKSKKFLAFYTITFPEGLSDADCYKFFNLWLTRCRRTGGLTTYLWVAERQKNHTIHFHMLTNDYMPIGKVNGYMAKALSNVGKKGHEKLLKVETAKYNGIDVKKVGGKRKALIGYLTKYITKNNIEFYRYPWHCSRNVSKLFNSQHIRDENSEVLLSKLPNDPDKYKIHVTDFCIVSAFKFIPDDKIFGEIDFVNELVYKTETHKN